MYELTVPFRSSTCDDVRRPYLHVEISCPNSKKFLKAVALVDTGADECVFPYKYAELIGEDLSKTTPLNTFTAAGAADSYSCEKGLKAFVDNHEILLPVDNIRFMKGLRTPILGVRTFLRYFKFTIDYPNQEFQIFFDGHQSDVTIHFVGENVYEVDQSTLG